MMKPINPSSILLLMVLSGFLTGCHKNRVYESYSPLDQQGWHKDSVLTWAFTMNDSAKNYTLSFNLRNTVDYPYSNIWLFVAIDPPGGNTLSDTVEFILADPSGQWLGSGYGKFRDNKLLYRQNVYFPDTGTYVFSVQQGMREEILKGIHDFGISIEKTNR
jgi:gliding motility-associated lipoprotein GldH